MHKTYVIGAATSVIDSLVNNDYIKPYVAAYWMGKTGESIFLISEKLEEGGPTLILRLLKEIIRYEKGETIIEGHQTTNILHLPIPKYKQSIIESSLENKLKSALNDNKASIETSDL